MQTHLNEITTSPSYCCIPIGLKCNFENEGKKIRIYGDLCKVICSNYQSIVTKMKLLS